MTGATPLYAKELRAERDEKIFTKTARIPTTLPTNGAGRAPLVGDDTGRELTAPSMGKTRI